MAQPAVEQKQESPSFLFQKKQLEDIIFIQKDVLLGRNLQIRYGGKTLLALAEKYAAYRVVLDAIDRVKLGQPYRNECKGLINRNENSDLMDISRYRAVAAKLQRLAGFIRAGDENGSAAIIPEINEDSRALFRLNGELITNLDCQMIYLYAKNIRMKNAV